MILATLWTAALFAAVGTADVRPGLPTVAFQPSDAGQTLDFSHLSQVVVDARFKDARDDKGNTLIPPTLLEFATTFSQDLKSIFGNNASVQVGDAAPSGSVFLTLDPDGDYRDAAGRWTSEGYSIGVDDAVVISAASPLGAWWGTRTVIQQLLLGKGSLAAGRIHDSPGWETRGIMLDVGRKYYPADHIIELCSYISFFKQNTFHLHLSDNLWNNVDLFDFEYQMKLYATFRLLSDDPLVAGLNKRPEESYSREVFDNIQSKCAARGVTILPEIDAPGHALVFSQWKPQIGMSSDYTLLNISHPETIPALKTVWKVFLPWFQSKFVSIGADEYRDASLSHDALVSNYELFCNELSDAIVEQDPRRRVRIWGTFPPRAGSHVHKSVSIHHWANFEAYAKSDWLDNGYSVLNSDDKIYVSAKYSSSYNQVMNHTYIFRGAPGGKPISPNIFDSVSDANNTVREDPALEGHIAPQWNNWGPNSTVKLESYHNWRYALPALADKQWGGSVSEDEYGALFDALHPHIPDQNLDRRIPSKGPKIVEYDLSHRTCPNVVKDVSGNEYHAKTSCPHSSEGVHLSPSCKVVTPLSSKGRNYTLSFSIKPTSAARGPILTGGDSMLVSGTATTPNVTLVADGEPYSLNYTFPIGQWTNAHLIGQGDRTFLAVGDEDPMEFNTRMGLRGRRFIWTKIAIEAPLHVIGGGEFEGIVGKMSLKDN